MIDILEMASSSYKEVIDSQPYMSYNITPEKLECVGHAQKRMGSRLRSIVQSYKSTKIPIHGRNKLTESAINSMQNYYGLAIRKNLSNVYAMKKAVFAILFHSTEFPDQNFRHSFCPRSENTWCKWQYDKIKGTSFYKNKISLPKWIHDIIKPIFFNLSADTLLLKCLHGESQNANECLNSLV